MVFLVANGNSIRGFFRPSVVLSVCLSVGLLLVFLTAENAKIMLDDKFQSPMKVICEPALTYAHLQMRADAYIYARFATIGPVPALLKNKQTTD